MKPIKVTDQELLSMGHELQRVRAVMEYWSFQYVDLKHEFMEKLREKHNIPETDGFIYEYETQMILPTKPMKIKEGSK